MLYELHAELNGQRARVHSCSIGPLDDLEYYVLEADEDGTWLVGHDAIAVPVSGGAEYFYSDGWQPLD